MNVILTLREVHTVRLVQGQTLKSSQSTYIVLQSSEISQMIGHQVFCWEAMGAKWALERFRGTEIGDTATLTIFTPPGVSTTFSISLVDRLYCIHIQANGDLFRLRIVRYL
jgi:hypothetical protein